MSTGLFKAAWDAFRAGINSVIKSGDTDASDPVLLVLKSLYNQSAGSIHEEAVVSCIRENVLLVFAQCQEALASEDEVAASKNTSSSTVRLIDYFGILLFKDLELSTVASTPFLLL